MHAYVDVWSRAAFGLAPGALPSPSTRHSICALPVSPRIAVRPNAVPVRMGLGSVLRRLFSKTSREQAQPGERGAVENAAGSDSGAVDTRSESLRINVSPSVSRRGGKRNPLNVLVVGADSAVGGEVVAALKALNHEYFVVGVSRNLSDIPPSCDSAIVLDVATDAATLATKAREFAVGTVIWCERTGQDRKPMDVDYAALQDLAKALAKDWFVDKEDSLRLFDFTKARDRASFSEVNDVIMGGISGSQLRAGGGSCPAVWSGKASLARGGGFCSLRAPLSGGTFSKKIDLSTCDGIALTCRGDGKRYKINLKNNESPEFAFQAVFDTAPRSSEWQTIRIPFPEFVPVKRSKPCYADHDPSGAIYECTLDTSSISSIGLVYSKVAPLGTLCPLFSPGPFELELARIDAYRAVPPRFVLVSSAAVTRPFWDEEKLRAYGAVVARIPIVQLNPKIGNLLGAKLAGENALRATKTPYAILRPTGISDAAPAGFNVNISQGDIATGRISARDVARCAVSTLGNDAATWKTFEVTSTQTYADDGSFAEGVTASLSRLLPDSEQVVYAAAMTRASPM
jgi:hypothetical protein